MPGTFCGGWFARPAVPLMALARVLLRGTRGERHLYLPPSLLTFLPTFPFGLPRAAARARVPRNSSGSAAGCWAAGWFSLCSHVGQELYPGRRTRDRQRCARRGAAILYHKYNLSCSSRHHHLSCAFSIRRAGLVCCMTLHADDSCGAGF